MNELMTFLSEHWGWAIFVAAVILLVVVNVMTWITNCVDALAEVVKERGSLARMKLEANTAIKRTSLLEAEAKVAQARTKELKMGLDAMRYVTENHVDIEIAKRALRDDDHDGYDGWLKKSYDATNEDDDDRA